MYVWVKVWTLEKKGIAIYNFVCTCERCKDEERGGHAFDTFLEESVCKNKICRTTTINLPSGMNIKGYTGKICAICGVNTL